MILLRDNRLDIIKGLAIVSVIMLHTLTIFWINSLSGQFILEEAVPIFMLVSGYVFTISYKNKGIVNLKNCYDLKIFTQRLRRLYIPFFVVYFTEIFGIYIYTSFINTHAKSVHLDIPFILKNLVLGGIGPGSYYPVLMFQFLFLFPLIYVFIYKNKNYSIPFFFTVSLFYEFFVYFSGISEGIYRLFIGRYLFVIVLGSYLALNQNKMNKMLLYCGSILRSCCKIT
jgi:peptidoglycan/LPS O-acetylase OafA/YrhL